MGKIERNEALRRIGAALADGRRPGVVVSFSLDSAGAVCVDIHAGDGVDDPGMVEAVLEMAQAGNATADLVYGRPPRVGGAVRGIVEHHQRGPVRR